MALKRTSRKTTEEQKPATSRKTLGNAANVARTQRPVAAAKPTPKISDEEKREKILQERFAPESIEFLKRNFGIDLHTKQVDVNKLYDFADGRLTPPVEAFVRPTAYSYDSKSRIEMAPLCIVASFKFEFPFILQNGVKKYIAPTEEHPVNVTAYPCYDFVMKDENFVPSEEKNKDDKVVEIERKDFSPSQLMALEGLGINDSRFYKNSFDEIPQEDRRAMLEGKEFPVKGTVQIVDSVTDKHFFLNINGRGKMTTRKDGTVVTDFIPSYPVEKEFNQTLDIRHINKIGNLEIDIYSELMPDGEYRRLKDGYGRPRINQGASDLVKYGVSFRPLQAFCHTRVKDNTGKWKDNVTKGTYQVSSVNGGLCATPMIKVMELDKDGNQIMTVNRKGEEVPKFHYEVSPKAKVCNGKVCINNQYLDPATPKDLDSYKRGRGGVFKGCEYTDPKTKKKVVYDVFAVPDNQRGGFAKGFRPSVSEELIKRQQDAKKTISKKQDFSMGF